MQGRHETSTIVETKVIGVILCLCEDDIDTGQDLCQGGEVEGLGVGNDPVEIKNNGAQLAHSRDSFVLRRRIVEYRLGRLCGRGIITRECRRKKDDGPFRGKWAVAGRN